MATVTHFIYSHYDPKDKLKLQKQTGQLDNDSDLENIHELEEEGEREEDPDELWRKESAFGAQRRVALAPHFVPAIVSYDEINNMMGVPQDFFKPPALKRGDDVSDWYRSITRSNTPSTSTATTHHDVQEVDRKPLSDPVSQSSVNTSVKKHRPNKNDWFISKVLNSEPQPTSLSKPTLAEILSRELPSVEKPLQPPVFLAIGPSNKGFEMLQRSGWSEGETLGAHVVRKPRVPTPQPRWTVKEEVKQEEMEVRYGSDDEITEVRKVEVVDLTLSDSDSDIVELPPPTQPASEEPLPEMAGRALLTPISTVLKSDRLGIGLKAKTEGPYKASKKRITHNQAALNAHVRAAEETRMMKKIMGRGTRAFARKHKADEEQRRQLLAHLNEQ